MRTRIAGVWAALGVSAAVGCAGRTSLPVTEGPGIADQCLVIPPPADPLDTVTVVVEERGYPSDSLLLQMTGGVLATASVRPAFPLAQVYDPLIHVTCDGRLVPGLAERWEGDSTGRKWTFTLRADARFSDASPVTAERVVDDWRMRSLHSLTVEFMRILPRATASGDRRIEVTTRDSQPGGPMLFGHQLLAAGGRTASGTWSLGTGAYTPDTAASDALRTVLRPAKAGLGPVIVSRVRAGEDARDLLDAGVTILETRDPAVVDYATRSGQFTVVPLPWDRTYALAVGFVDDSLAPRLLESPEMNALRRGLARDAILVDGREATLPAWWSGDEQCRVFPPRFRHPVMTRRPEANLIVYDSADPVARSLAERLVAIARATRETDSSARALADLIPRLSDRNAPALTAAPTSGLASATDVETAHVLAVPRVVTARCLGQADVTQAHDWIWFSRSRLVPLVETRSYLIARRGAPAVSIDWEGTLRVHPSPR